jgi:hypothetical protein
MMCAAPYGSIDPRFREILRPAGYEICYSCAPGVADIRGDPYAVPRIEVMGGWSAADLATALGRADAGG